MSKFLDNENGLPALWLRIKEVFALKNDIPTDNADLDNGAGYQTEAQVNTIVTGKGYQTAAQVTTAITGKGYQTAAQVKTAVEKYGYQTASQVDSKINAKIGSAINYKGSVATESALPTAPNANDMYNITAKSTYGAAGTNVVWTGTVWDPMGGSFAVEAMTASEVQSICT